MGRSDGRTHRRASGETALRLTDVSRYWHTLRHLRPVQFYGRAWFRFWRPRPNLGPAPAVRSKTTEWLAPAAREPSLLAKDTFIFLGEPGSLGDVGWDGPQREKLWRYNQHYFDDLNAAGAASRRDWHVALIEDWVALNPAAHGTGWESYPVSLRIVNWVKWALAGNALSPNAQHSLAVQARWLSRRLEIHLLGNHLFSNAKALVFAGLFFVGSEADRWRATGLRLLRAEVREQILADGGHFERSTMYHALALEDMLDLCNVCGAFGSALAARELALVKEWRTIAASMLQWLKAMCHPDGEISFFNDAAFGIAPLPGELQAYAARLGIAGPNQPRASLKWMEVSGYARCEINDAVALLDLAPVGPDYLPGHAHADSLSFELSVQGQRLLVNSGTSCYGTGSQRLKERGTASHNTVVVDRQDSSEVWSGFRVARRAKVQAQVVLHQDAVVATGMHDGYARLAGRPLHRRRWTLRPSALEVIDAVHPATFSTEARFHFHPEWMPVTAPDGLSGRATSASGKSVTWRVENGSGRLEPSQWHPRFGTSVRNTCLVVQLHQGRSRVVFQWGQDGFRRG